MPGAMLKLVNELIAEKGGWHYEGENRTSVVSMGESWTGYVVRLLSPQLNIIRCALMPHLQLISATLFHAHPLIRSAPPSPNLAAAANISQWHHTRAGLWLFSPPPLRARGSCT